MSDFNYDKILTSSQKKQLIIGFNTLKENYTESTAKEYSELYKDKPLSFILENSEFIFTEPYYGLPFYESVILNKCIAYPKLEDEMDKIDAYMYIHESSMSDSQKELYTNLRKKIDDFCQENKNRIMVSGFAYESSDDSEKNVVEKLWDDFYSDDATNSFIESFSGIKNPASYLSYIPDVVRKCGNSTPIAKTISNVISESASTDVVSRDDSIVPFCYSIFLMNKLSNDSNFKESVEKIPNAHLRMTLNGLMNESVIDHLNKMREVDIDEEYFPESVEFAVGHLFDGFMSMESSEGSKEYFESIDSDVYDKVIDFMMYEYTHLAETDVNILGYESVIDETMTYDDAMRFLTEKKDTSYQSIANAMPKSVTTSIQVKAMDKEVEHYKKKAERNQKGMKIKSAVKAVTAIPENIMNGIKNTIAEWDKADDDRRKKFIVKPGFRKKIFQNMKLAIMYGATATVNLLWVPFLAIIRHFSKMKDRRIRNELIREVETEIKICDEKINDANSNNDTDKKYKLMRIKAKLEEELLRIKSNSKYI